MEKVHIFWRAKSLTGSMLSQSRNISLRFDISDVVTSLAFPNIFSIMVPFFRMVTAASLKITGPSIRKSNCTPAK